MILRKDPEVSERLSCFEEFFNGATVILLSVSDLFEIRLVEIPKKDCFLYFAL